MSIVITGATGHFGRLVVESLLERGVEPTDIVATGRDVTRLADLADRGVTTKVADYDDPSSLDVAFAGADRVLLVSGLDFGKRVAQHGNAIDAAKKAGVQLIAYSSITRADSIGILLAEDHKATEKLLTESGVPAVFLRNDLYLEVYTAQLPVFLERGIVGSAGEGRLSGAAREDLAEAAAAVLLEESPASVYELAGDEAFTFAELAAAVTEASGQPVTYTDIPVADYIKVLEGAGLPAQVAEVLADSHRAIADGSLHVTSGDLARLIGHPTTTIAEALQAEVATQK